MAILLLAGLLIAVSLFACGLRAAGPPRSNRWRRSVGVSSTPGVAARFGARLGRALERLDPPPPEASPR